MRRFLEKIEGITSRKLHIEKASSGVGAADQFVKERYVRELQVVRKCHVNRTLIVVLDGDKFGVKGRLRQLDDACAKKGVLSKSRKDKVKVFVPTWNIEAWFAYLDGKEVDEKRKDYPKLPRERECKKHVKKLAQMCKAQKLRDPVPASLKAACEEHNKKLR